MTEPGTDGGATAPHLKRRLGFGLLTFYGVGVMVGAGIYVLVGQVAGAAGEWAPLAFLVAGLVALPTAVSYAELSSRIPESAGEAAYLWRATGSQALAILVGLAVAAVGVISAAAVLQGGVGYLTGVLDLPAPWLMAGIGVLLGIAAVLGVLESLSLAAIFTAVEAGGLIVVAAAGFSADPVALPEAAGAGGIAVAGLAAASFLAFFAFIGFEDMVNMAEETRRPERTMPRAILAAVAITTALYILVSFAAVRAVPPADLAASQRPLALVYERATGHGSGFLALIAVAAAMNGVLAQIVMSARVLYGLGRRSPLFMPFHKAHPRFGTPVLATVLATGLVILLALVAPLVGLAETTSTVLLGVFLAMNLALIALKRRELALIALKRRELAPEGTFRVPMAVPVAGAALAAGALIWGLLA